MPALALPPLIALLLTVFGQQADPEHAELARWLKRYQRNGPELELERVQELERVVADLRMLAMTYPERRPAVAVSLLDLAGVRTAEEERMARRDQRAALELSRRADRVRRLGLEALGRLLDATDGDLARFLATEILSSPAQPTPRRLAALRLLEERYVPGTELALFSCAVEPDEEVRAAAMRALQGWPEDAVHRFMLSQRAKLDRVPDWIPRGSVRRHFETVQLQPGSPIAAELMSQASVAAVGTDWRAAFRAIGLLRCLPDDPAFGALIDALETWVERRKAGAGSRRIEYELLRELERRSGRHLGPFPERWAAWWKARGADPAAEGLEARSLTRAEFFGLRPATDRMVFVIDRSGSMRHDFAGGERSRYGEAVEQMLSFLRTLGPEARFTVVLFSDGVEEWKSRLQRATPSSLAAAERWLRYRGPKGGTYLKPAIEAAMHLDWKGRVDLTALEADSVIVLCDGATTEGRGWIRPLLERTNDDACLAFHGVQIGSGGDGALQLLAELSGGSFVRVAE